jgi:hypothetical protein
MHIAYRYCIAYFCFAVINFFFQLAMLPVQDGPEEEFWVLPEAADIDYLVMMKVRHKSTFLYRSIQLTNK